MVAVPLEIAIALTHWNFCPTKILVHPSFHRANTKVAPNRNENDLYQRESDANENAGSLSVEHLPHAQIVNFGDANGEADFLLLITGKANKNNEQILPPPKVSFIVLIHH